MDDAPRPALPIRILVLVIAIASLGLVMCTRSQPPASPVNRTSSAAATPDAGEAPPPSYFPATKAAGPIYPQPQQAHH